MNIVIALLIGAVAGYVAGALMGGKGGLVRNIIVGLLGGLIGGWLFPKLGLNLAITDNGLVNTGIVATAGAVVLLFVAQILSK